MGLLNLTLAQFLAVLLPLVGGLVALYFYDRSRRRIRVPTLRFWGDLSAHAVARRHKKVQQPWSLFLQLLAAVLLLLAIADFRWQGGAAPRHHAILLDGSAAMLYRTAGGGAAMEQARQRALDYLDALPASDPVALIRADAAPSVVVGYTTRRDKLRQAIRDFQPAWTSLRLDAALALAQSSLFLAIGEPIDGPTPSALGETTYVGAGRLAPGSEPLAQTPYFRHIRIGGVLDDLGIVRFGAARDAAEPGLWRVSLELLNDSNEPLQTTAQVEFNGSPLGQRQVRLAARDASVVEFRIRTSGAGRLEAFVESDDALVENNRVALELPAAPQLATAFLTSRSGQWQSLLAANPAIVPTVDPSAALRIADRGSGAESAQLWIDPLAAESPIPIVRRANRLGITAWAPGHPATRGLRETDVRLVAASVLEPSPGDVVLVESSAGPIAVAREMGAERMVVLGFDLLDPAVSGRLTGPLLFANIVSWFAPETFQSVVVEARPPGVLQMQLGAFDDSLISVQAPSGSPPIWFRRGDELRLFRSVNGVVRVRTPAQDSQISMTLPAPANTAWQPDAEVRLGIPESIGGIAGAPFWPWLSLLAAALLLADWRLFGDSAALRGRIS